jgi:tetratricopeptide (TPR) repeat protein
MRRTVLMMSIFACICGMQALSAESAQALFDRAIRLKAQSLGAQADRLPGAETVESEARGLFTQAANLFEIEAQTDRRRWYEAGNARWWAGQADRAIRDYRRYLSFDAFRSEVWENLSQARAAAGTEVPGNEGILSRPWFLIFASLAAFFAGTAFLTFAFFMFFRKKVFRKTALIFVAAACCSGIVSFAGFTARGRMGIVIAETRGRKGDSEAYSPSPALPWKAGQEVWVDEVRDTWTRIRVGNTVSWVPTSSLTLFD